MPYLEDFIAHLAEYPALFGGVIFIFGVCIGSFLNVVIYRLPLMIQSELAGYTTSEGELDEYLGKQNLNLAFPRSFCTHCRTNLGWTDNIPVFSYLKLGGKCKYCQAPIGIKYPAIELLSGLVTLILGIYFGCSIKFLLSCVLLYALIALYFIDLNTFLLPDALTIPLIWCGMLVNSFNVFTPLKESLYGAVLGYLILWLVYWVFKFFTGKDGFGFGDFKLLSALGAWLGFGALPFIVFISSLSGSLIGLGLIYFKKIGKNSPMPFGPYLIMGGVVMLLYPELIHFLY